MNSGLIALVAFLFLILKYLKDSVCLYFRRPLEGTNSYIGFGVSLAILGYMITGFFNDSVVTVAPVFWGLLGLGIASNRINAQSLANTVAPEAR
jgi:hypothetical protein